MKKITSLCINLFRKNCISRFVQLSYADTGCFFPLVPPLKVPSTKKLIWARLGVSRPIYANVDSPNIGFPYFNFLGGYQWKKIPCIWIISCCCSKNWAGVGLQGEQTKGMEFSNWTKVRKIFHIDSNLWLHMYVPEEEKKQFLIELFARCLKNRDCTHPGVSDSRPYWHDVTEVHPNPHGRSTLTIFGSRGPIWTKPIFHPHPKIWPFLHCSLSVA